MALVLRSEDRQPLSALIRECAEPIADIKSAECESLLRHIDGARVVLIGEATHGTSEFYRMRAHITRLLIEQLGFNVIGIEGDWPDAAHVDAYVRGMPRAPGAAPEEAFSRFPRWMWRNLEVAVFVDWLRARNAEMQAGGHQQVGFYGLDLYSLFASLEAVLGYLDRTSPDAAKVARARYACLMPWRDAIQVYGQYANTGAIEACADDAVAMLQHMLQRRIELVGKDGAAFFDAVMNARLVANAERYYRAMFLGYAESWNLRDTHMMETLEAVLVARGPSSRAVVWAHNSHVGDARFTQKQDRDEINIGQLARERFGDRAYIIGFGTDHGTVAAASDWDEPMEVKAVRPSRADSYEHLCHGSDVAAFILALREPRRVELVEELAAARLERAIGVVYRPETERWSHYFHAVLPKQFDSFIWFDESHAVTPLESATELVGPPITEPIPETFPTGM